MMDEEWQFWRFCNSFLCRVVEFYAENEKEVTCPSCNAIGAKEAE